VELSENAKRVIIPLNWLRLMSNAGKADRTAEKTF
jgi:hypothetical protein